MKILFLLLDVFTAFAVSFMVTFAILKLFDMFGDAEMITILWISLFGAASFTGFYIIYKLYTFKK